MTCHRIQVVGVQKKGLLSLIIGAYRNGLFLQFSGDQCFPEKSYTYRKMHILTHGYIGTWILISRGSPHTNKQNHHVKSKINMNY